MDLHINIIIILRLYCANKHGIHVALHCVKILIGLFVYTCNTAANYGKTRTKRVFSACYKACFRLFVPILENHSHSDLIRIMKNTHNQILVCQINLNSCIDG
jgi:hypothetical protein